MTSNIPKPLLGDFVPLTELATDEQLLVHGSWSAAENANTPLSKFPVGAMLSAKNDAGECKIFSGCNVECRFMSCTICAERNAMTSAIADGYKHLNKIALVLKLYQGPGASPCGLCRQVLFEFGSDAIVFQAADKDRNVARYLVKDLLPAASGDLRPYSSLTASEKRLVKRLLQLRSRAYVPYSKKPASALFSAVNNQGARRVFAGLADDNSSYGASGAAEVGAMRSAKTAGYIGRPSLMLTVDDPKAVNPVEGESLQVLREFGKGMTVTLVGSDGSSVVSTLDELLPDSFGPESLV